MKRLSLILLALCSLAAGQSSTGASVTPAGDESTIKARALINQAIQALGGNAYLNVVDSSMEGRTYSMHHGQATSSGLIFFRDTKFPDKERTDLTKKRDVSYVYTGDHGFVLCVHDRDLIGLPLFRDRRAIVEQSDARLVDPPAQHPLE